MDKHRIRTATTAVLISLKAAQITLYSAAVSLALLALLHVLSPEYAPSWRMVSEYANGNFGWVLTLTFFAMAVSCVALYFTLSSQIETKWGKIGLKLLLVVAGALTIASFFHTDPITAKQGALTISGNIHVFASIVGVPGFALAAMLITYSLMQNPAWASSRRMLLIAANFTWISFALLLLVIGVMLPQNGGFGPNVIVGWPHRVLMLSYSGWLMIVAWRAIKLRG